MQASRSNELTSRRPLRVWPGATAAALLLFFRLVLPLIAPETVLLGFEAGVLGLLGTAICVVAIVVWWLFFSRAPWIERLGAIALTIVALVATARLVHVSIAEGGMGVLLYVLAVPVLAVCLVAWAAATRGLSDGLRRTSLCATLLLACGSFTLIRTSGVTSDVIGSALHWRWSPTPEERLLARASDAPEPSSAAAIPPRAASGASIVEAEAEWPGFRGPRRDGSVRSVQIATDWSASPPVELWRRPIGPGWSSFAVRGDLLFTQEQRGDDELVTCYEVTTGAPVWQHRDAARFWESNAGAGPRATPTLRGERVYAFGATGILNALAAASGARIWSRDVAADTGRAVPEWGFSSSPLVQGGLVIVAAAGTLVAYDAATGDPCWRGPSYGGSYSSPHHATLDGVDQILLLGGPGAISVAPADGAVLWEHSWAPGAIVQPALTEGGDLLVHALSAMGGLGLRRLHVTRGAEGWGHESRWTSRGLKPYFNDFVVHEGHAFGFDGSMLACIDLEGGERQWKGGRYGNGQLLLLPDQDVLLVVSEDGELVLVNATTAEFEVLARFPALEGKTWNHPALVRDVLLVRNGEEMAAFRLQLR